MAETIEELKNKIAEYEKRMGIGEDDPSKDGYIVLVEILRQQNEYLKTFKIKNAISSDDAAKKIEYKNAKDLWEGLPSLIQSVNKLRIELKMEGEEKTNIYRPISAKEIANRSVQ